jgi:hypothetical protein
MMSGLFSKPEKPALPPGPDPETVAAQRRQEQRVESRERDSAAQIAARKRARRSGGNRLLLADRENPFLGIPENESLGPGYSRRSANRTV